MTLLGLLISLSAAAALAEEASPAPSEPTAGEASFEELVAEAVEHYGARRYEQAIELFERALELSQEPELAYNIARSHERLAHTQEAVTWYERFLEMPGSTGEIRARARNNLNALRQELAAMEAATPAAPPPPETAPPETPPEAPPVEIPSMTAMGVAGLVLLGVGGAAMIVGAIFDGLALSSQDAFEAAGFDQERLQLRDEMESRALVGDVLLFGGVVVAVTGLMLFVLDRARQRRLREPQGRSPTLGPALAGGGAGLSGRF